MNDQELIHYSRHILLNQFDIEAQEKLTAATVLVVGCGGLGNACLPLLNGAGVGRLLICDHDIIDPSNLQRQYAFTKQDVGQSKAHTMAQYLAPRNPYIQHEAFNTSVDEAFLDQYLPECDVLVDCTDHSEIRHVLNQGAFKHKVPLVSASVIQFSGQLIAFDFKAEHSPCYACLFPKTLGEDTCAKHGVFAPMVYTIGAMQANEIIKLITGVGQVEYNTLRQVEGFDFSISRFDFEKNSQCPVCSRIKNN